jgi:hypothetical protein
MGLYLGSVHAHLSGHDNQSRKFSSFFSSSGFLARTPGLDKTSKKKEFKPSASASEITLLISET